MTQSADFPGNCSTNIHILNDFGEVAYIVCTIATAAATPAISSVPEPNTPESNVTRLRTAEKQFRQASILVALDAENLQLFTFYKKVDLMKDSKTLLSRVNFLVKSNNCVPAYKAAARTLDFFKAENARLYRLFVTAVLSSIVITPSPGQNIIRTGLRSCLVETADLLSPVQELLTVKKWALIQIDVQLLTTGQLILTTARVPAVALLPASNIENADLIKGDTSGHRAAYLAPLGQVARYTGGWIGKVFKRDESSVDVSPTPLLDDSYLLQAWFEELSLWLRADIDYSVNEPVGRWIEVEIPVWNDIPLDDHKEVGMSARVGNPPVLWKRVFWPAWLTFLQCTDGSWPSQTVPGTAETTEDPLQVLEDWMTGSATRVDVDMNLDSRPVDPLTNEQDHLFNDDTPFGSEPFQNFGPPAFPASQLIYPTPPDAILTHATPGMSSVDGIAMTPANMIKFGVDTNNSQTDHEMADNDFGDVPRKTSGYYDEDLFDGIPGDSFTPQDDEEPDWDIFGQPPMDDKPDDTNIVRDAAMSESRDAGFGDAAGKRSWYSSQDVQTANDASLTADTKYRTNDPEFLAAESKVDEQNSFSSQLSQLHPQHASAGANGDASGVSGRRRSSVYEPIQPRILPANYDQKYANDGQFWFDPNFESSAATLPDSKTLRRQSSSSYSSSSSQSDYISIENKSPVSRPVEQSSTFGWTEYQLEQPVQKPMMNDVVLQQAVSEVRHLLESLQSQSVEVPNWNDFAVIERDYSSTSVHSTDATMIAQIMIDQVTPTSFSYKNHLVPPLDRARTRSHDPPLDLSSLGTIVPSSTLNQMLQNIQPVSPDKSLSKLTRISQRQICLKRAGRELCASASILHFWDTMGLQPLAQSKNITAFCVHPASKQVSEASRDFLERIGDAYKTSNLGSHSVSRVAGISNDGLVAWSEDEPTMPGLRLACQRLGAALATSPDLRDNVVVYMVFDENQPQALVDLCRAFQVLFQSFAKNILHKQASTEIALQIIPQSFITSFTSLAVPSLAEYITLAIEVYNRLPTSGNKTSIATCSSATTLAEQNASVTFELSIMPASPFTRDGVWLNLAYSVSYDQRWLVAAWTDDRGLLALSMTYYLRPPNSGTVRSRSDVFKELWAISGEIMSKENGTWRLVVCRHGFYERGEADEWLQLTKEDNPQSPANCRLLLVSLDSDPAIDVTPQPQYLRPVAPTAVPAANQTINTPSSTPQTGVLSPDQLIPATPTPGGTTWATAPTSPEAGFDHNNEADLTLIDMVQESWSVVLPYGANQSRNTLEIRPSMASGYILKRSGSADEDGITAIGVHLVHLGESKATRAVRPYGEILEEILQEFRGLAILAGSRGCTDQATEILPWHVATAAKGAHLLSTLL